MPVFPSIEGEPGLDKIFRRFPNSAMPLLEYHDRLLRDRSPLTVAERELIAAYVSGLNACTYCHGAHVVAARAFGVDENVFEGLMNDLASSQIDEKLKPILAYVGKLTRTPAMMTDADAEAIYAAGWDEQALFDAVSVCALFNLMNRIIEGCGIKSNPLDANKAEMDARIARMGGATLDPHVGEPSYTRLGPDMGYRRKHLTLAGDVSSRSAHQALRIDFATAPELTSCSWAVSGLSADNQSHPKSRRSAGAGRRRRRLGRNGC